MHPNLRKHVSLVRSPKVDNKLVAWPYRFADKEGSYSFKATVNNVVCFKDGIQVPAHEPDGTPFYFIDVLCGWGYTRILMNKPDVYFLADTGGDFIMMATRKMIQDLGAGDQKIVNTALRQFRKHVRRGTKAWGCPICNRTGVQLYEDEYICQRNGGPCA